VMNVPPTLVVFEFAVNQAITGVVFHPLLFHADEGKKQIGIDQKKPSESHDHSPIVFNNNYFKTILTTAGFA
jgi:hypothetical protein